MKPQPFSSLNHLTLPTAIFPPLQGSTIPGARRLRAAEGGPSGMGRHPPPGRAPSAAETRAPGPRGGLLASAHPHLDMPENDEAPRSERRQGRRPTEHRSSREKSNSDYKM